MLLFFFFCKFAENWLTVINRHSCGEPTASAVNFYCTNAFAVLTMRWINDDLCIFKAVLMQPCLTLLRSGPQGSVSRIFVQGRQQLSIYTTKWKPSSKGETYTWAERLTNKCHSRPFDLSHKQRSKVIQITSEQTKQPSECLVYSKLNQRHCLQLRHLFSFQNWKKLSVKYNEVTYSGYRSERWSALICRIRSGQVRSRGVWEGRVTSWAILL